MDADGGKRGKKRYRSSSGKGGSLEAGQKRKRGKHSSSHSRGDDGDDLSWAGRRGGRGRGGGGAGGGHSRGRGRGRGRGGKGKVSGRGGRGRGGGKAGSGSRKAHAPPMPNDHTFYVDSDATADAMIAHIRGAKENWISVDSEFHNRNCYQPSLCLIQIGTADQVFLVDTLAKGKFMLRIYEEVLFNVSIVKVFHAADQDLRVMHSYYDDLRPWKANDEDRPDSLTIEPLHDTQVASQFLADIDHTPGYEKLVKEVLDIDLPKSPNITRSDWTRRPLSAGQLQYAYNDARYLFQLYSVLRKQLEAGGRLKWFRETCDETTSHFSWPDGDIRLDRKPTEAWKSVKGKGWLTDSNANPVSPADPKFPAVRNLRVLAAWRETTASKRNCPKPWVMNDKMLVYLAGCDDVVEAAKEVDIDHSKRQIFKNPDHLSSALGRELAKHYRKFDSIQYEPSSRRKLNRHEAAERDNLVTDVLEELREKCAKMDISSGVVVTKRQLTELLSSPADSPIHDLLLSSWRKDIVADVIYSRAGRFMQNKR